MNLHPMRDWFGLASFDPASEQKTGSLYLLDTVGSTSDFLLGRGGPAPGRVCRWDGWGWHAGPLQEVAPPRFPVPGEVAVARRQTRGRGRRGRTWQDVGGLHLSWVFRTARSALAAGLAVWTGLIAAVVLGERYGLEVGLKWPNDLIADGKKLGGLLLDRPGNSERPAVVAGLGLNLVAGPGEFPRILQGRATSLEAETGRRVRPGAVAGALMVRLGRELPRFEREGWDPYRALLRRHDWLRGRRVWLSAQGRRVGGTVEGIDGDGRLLLRRERGGTFTVTAGDVHVWDVGGGSDEDPRR